MTFMTQIETKTTPETLQFWQNELNTSESFSSLPHDVTRRTGSSPTYAQLRHPIEPALSQALSRLCVSIGCDALAIMTTSVGLLLGRYSNSNAACLGIPSDVGADSEFAKFLPLTLNLDPQTQVATAIRHTQVRIGQLNRHANIEDRQLQDAATYNAHPFYQVRVDCADHQTNASIETQNTTPEAPTDLTLRLERDQLQITYAQDVFHAQTIVRMASRLTEILDQVSARSTATLRSISMIPQAEKLALAAQYDAPLEASTFDTIPHMISAMAQLQPNAVAVRDHDHHLSYQDIETLSDRIASFLSQRGVKKGSKVGVYVRRSPELVAWLIGILKLGAIYVPIDTRYPVDRVKTLLEDAPCDVCLVDPDSAYALPRTCTRISLNAFNPQKTHNDVPHRETTESEDTAYLIYTSGSTGRPKGIRINHANVVNLLEWTRNTFSKADLGLVAATTSLNFDMSVFEIFGTLAAGGTILMLDDALDIIDSPLQHAITLIDTVPSAIAALLPLAPDLESCRVINLGGEALQRTLCDQIHATLPGVRLYNMYGPSETTTFSTFAQIPAAGTRTPNIGKPLRNTQLLICDEDGALTPTGMIGELFIGGSGVSQGYLNRPELTSSKYVSCGTHGTKGLFFRTGDLVSWGADGELRYHGRMDHQIKIRGHRVELGEVDAALNAAPGVKNGVTIGTTLPGRAGTALVAYVIGSKDIDGLKAHLSSVLPSYMVPSYIVPLAALPLNANGKLDRAQLPDPIIPARPMKPMARTPQADLATLVASQTSGTGHAAAAYAEKG